MANITDLEMMKNNFLWPCWPYLPIKNRKPVGMPECALLWAYTHKQTPVPVYKAYLYRLPKTAADFANTKYKEYNSLEELIADGWEVD